MQEQNEINSLMNFKEFYLERQRLLLEANPEKRIEYLYKTYYNKILKHIEFEWGYNNDGGKDDAKNKAFVSGIINRIVLEIDPTQGEYSEWIVKCFLKLSMNESKRFLEDSYKIHDDLEKYHKYKKYFKKYATENDDPGMAKFSDINKIESFRDLYTKLDYIEEYIEEDENKQNLKDAEKEVKKIYDSDKFLILTPETKEASCAYGRGTRWCTAATGSSNYFDQYNRQGPLYVIIEKETQTKWQFHFQSEQYMDTDDSPINIFQFFKDNKEIEDVLINEAAKNGNMSFMRILKPDDAIAYIKNKSQNTAEIYRELFKSAYLTFKWGLKEPEFINNIQNLFHFKPDKSIAIKAKTWGDLDEFIQYDDQHRQAREIIEGDDPFDLYMNDNYEYDSEYWDWLNDENRKDVFKYIKNKFGKDFDDIDDVKEFIDEKGYDDDADDIKDLLAKAYNATSQQQVYDNLYKAALAPIIDILGDYSYDVSGNLMFENWNQEKLQKVFDKIISHYSADSSITESTIGQFFSFWAEVWHENDDIDKINFDRAFNNTYITKKENGGSFNEYFSDYLVIPKDLLLRQGQTELELSSFDKTINQYMKLLNEEEKKYITLYHVTSSKNTDSIIKNGLLPKIGDRSKQMNDQEGIYLFDSIDAVHDAIMNWLGDEFDENDQLDLFKIMVPNNFPLLRNNFEVISNQPIPPENVYLIKRNI